MDNDSRRGDSNMADADVKPDSGNSDENKSDTKMSEVESQAAGGENTCQNSSVENSVEENVAAPTAQVTSTEPKDTEETKKQLANLREELNRAKEASARAKDEVERAKKDLADAKQDTAKTTEEKVEENKANAAKQEEPISTVQESAEKEPQSEQTIDIAVVTESVSSSNQNADIAKPVEEPTAGNAQVEHESPSEEARTEKPLTQSREENDHDDAHSEHEDEEDVGSEEEHDEDLEEEGEEEEIDEEDGEKASDDEAAAKPLDDDEDRRNPQYIPKRGGFYEHDDRTREEGEETVPEQPEVEEKPKKGMRSEAVDRWGHDMYDESQQTPKSNHELVAVYGYDIRQEEGAPRARRRRRYGRGPNKYDRTWEDEEAYNRTRGGRGAGRGGPSRGSDARRQRPERQETPKKEDFPPLGDQRKDSKPSDERPAITERAEKDTESLERRTGGKSSAISFRRGGGGRTFEERGKPRTSKPRSDNEDKQLPPHEADAREVARDPRSPRGRGESSRGGIASRGSRGGSSRGAGPSPRGRGSASYRGGRQAAGESGNWKEDDEPQQQSRSAAHQHGSGRTFHGQQQNADNHRSFDESRGRGGRGRFNRSVDEHAIAGGMEQMRIDSQSASRQQDATRSKRYSSQRQRMTTPPPAAVPVPQYPVGGNNSANYYTSYNDSPPPNYVQTAPGPMLPMAVAAQSAPPAYMGPPMYPAGPGPAPFPGAAYQGYPAAAGPPPVQVGVPIGSPTQDNMYGGGIMYYDPGRQHIRHGAQPMPQRRAKAAIPIVAPDGDHDSYMVTGRPSHHE